MSKKEIQEYLRENLPEFTSDSDIKDYLPGVKIKTYSEIKNIKNIDDLIPGNCGSIILLLEWDVNKGHWVCLSKYMEGKKVCVEFFNSYGEKPGFEVEMLSKSLNKMLDQSPRDILDILDDSFYRKRNVIYNARKLQKEGNDIATCGKHCILRSLLLKKCDMDLKAYLKFMTAMSKKLKLSPDEIVTLMIEVD